MKRFLTSLLTYTTSMSYIIFSEWLNKWQILIPRNQTKLICLSPSGEQGKQFNDDFHQPLRLQFLRSLTVLTEIQVLQISIWRSLTALTASLKSQFNFSLLLSHYWQSSFIISPALLQVVEGRPLIHLKAIGVIWMISNISMPVKRSGELLHIFGGV